MNPEDAKGELLRVRRELASVEDQLNRVSRELDKAVELGDSTRLEDNRHIRICLWKEKEQLRNKEEQLPKEKKQLLKKSQGTQADVGRTLPDPNRTSWRA